MVDCVDVRVRPFIFMKFYDVENLISRFRWGI